VSEQKRTHWKELADPRYIGAYALPNGDDLTVTITRVQREEVTVDGGRKEEHTVVYLQDQKPLILNATNGKTIARLYGPYIEEWVNKRITLFGSTARLGNDLVECLRIRPSVPAASKKGISADRLARALEQIKAGTYTLAKLRAGFALTEAQERQVTELEGVPADE
jgi:hypothetical protein